MTYHLQTWKYGQPNPTIWALGQDFPSVEDAMTLASERFGIALDSFEEPFFPILIDTLAGDACDKGLDLAVVHDDQGGIVAYAPIAQGLERRTLNS